MADRDIRDPLEHAFTDIFRAKYMRLTLSRNSLLTASTS